MKTWKDIGIVNSKDYALMQNPVDSMNPPTKLGVSKKDCIWFCWSDSRRVEKLDLGIFFMYALHGIVPIEHYSCWCVLVN